MALEPILIDEDPPVKGYGKSTPVTVKLDGVPPVATSSGWGDMSWARKR